MTGILFLATVLVGVMAWWTKWTAFYGLLYMGIVATVVAFVVSIVTRDREPRGAHYRR